MPQPGLQDNQVPKLSRRDTTVLSRAQPSESRTRTDPSFVLEDRVAEHLFDRWAPPSYEPALNRYAEPPFRPAGDVVTDLVAYKPSQDRLQATAMKSNAVRKRSRELPELVVEKRRSRLDSILHSATIDLRHVLPHEARKKFIFEEVIEDGASRRRQWWRLRVPGAGSESFPE